MIEGVIVPMMWRYDRNMGEGTMVLLCRLGLLLVGERTSSSSF